MNIYAMSKDALQMLEELNKIEPLSDFQRKDIERIIKVAYNDGRIDEFHKLVKVHKYLL